jgi:hypothetical protein
MRARLLHAAGRRRFGGYGWRRWLGRDDKTSTPAAAYLTTLAAGIPCFISCPFMSRAFFVRRAAAFAGNLALLLRRHRCEPSTFFPFSVIHR